MAESVEIKRDLLIFKIGFFDLHDSANQRCQKASRQEVW